MVLQVTMRQVRKEVHQVKTRLAQEEAHLVWTQQVLVEVQHLELVFYMRVC